MRLNLPSARLLLHEAQALLERGLAVGGRVDDKAANLVTFNAVVLGLLATGFTVAPFHTPAWALAILGLGPLLLIASMLCAIRSYRPMEYAVGIAPGDLASPSPLHCPESKVLVAALRAYQSGIERNDIRLKTKVLWARRALQLLAAGLLATVVSIAFIIPFLAWGAR